MAEVRRDLAKEALLTGVTATYPVPSAVVEHLHKIITEEREVQTLIFNIDQYMGDVKVTPDEVKAYYDGHQSEFMADEHVTAQYVVLSPESFKPPSSPMKRTFAAITNRTSSATPRLRSVVPATS